MPPLGLAIAGFVAVFAVMVYGSVTRNVTAQRVLFWSLLSGIALVTYLFR